jgi:hypothetical protein
MTMFMTGFCLSKINLFWDGNHNFSLNFVCRPLTIEALWHLNISLDDPKVEIINIHGKGFKLLVNQ